MTCLLEDYIEVWAIDILKELGWQFVSGSDLHPNDVNAERKTFKEVVLRERFAAAIRKLKPDLAERLVEEAVREVAGIAPTDLLAANEAFHAKLTDGVKLEATSAFYSSVTEIEAGEIDVLNQKLFVGPRDMNSYVDFKGWFTSTRANFEIPCKGSTTLTSFHY